MIVVMRCRLIKVTMDTVDTVEIAHIARASGHLIHCEYTSVKKIFQIGMTLLANDRIAMLTGMVPLMQIGLSMIDGGNRPCVVQYELANYETVITVINM